MLAIQTTLVPASEKIIADHKRILRRESRVVARSWECAPPPCGLKINLFLRMLFQTFYNWIKYKTLPPSFLARNRLHIERNSQRARITAQLGETFKSAKWSLFTQLNLKKSFKPLLQSDLAPLYLLLGLFLMLLFGAARYSPEITFLFWVNVDIFDYYFTFLVWFFFFALSLASSNMYSFLFFNNFANPAPRATPRIAPAAVKDFFFKEKSGAALPDLGWVAHAWLTKQNRAEDSDRLVDALFAISGSPEQWQRYYALFPYLYKINYLNGLFALNTRDLKMHVATLLATAPALRLINLPIDPNEVFRVKLGLWYTLAQERPHFTQKLKISQTSSPFFNKNAFVKSIFVATAHAQDDSFLAEKPSALFSSHLTRSRLNYWTASRPTAAAFPALISNDISASKAHRWLYRYYLLNRKLFKNSQKMTQFKSLIGANSMGASFFFRNLWNTCYLSSDFNFKHFTQITRNNAYKAPAAFPPFSQNEFVVNAGAPDNLFFFKFIENSYFWLAKRAFFFNSSRSYTLVYAPTYAAVLPPSSLVDSCGATTQRAAFTRAYALTRVLPNFLTYSAELTHTSHAPSHALPALSFSDLSLSTPSADFFSMRSLRLFSALAHNDFNGNRLFFFNYLTAVRQTPSLSPNKMLVRQTLPTLTRDKGLRLLFRENFLSAKNAQRFFTQCERDVLLLPVLFKNK